MLDYAFKLIESLRAEVFKSRTERQKALDKKEKAKSRCIHANLKLDQMLTELDNAQNALDAMEKDGCARAVQEAFDAGETEHWMQMAKREIT